MQETKICKKCGRELPATEEYFYKNKQLKDGLENSCKECRGYKFGKYKNLEPTIEEHKVCAHCKKEFPATDEYFSRDNHSKDGLRYNCLKCSRIENNKNYNPEQKRQYYLNNKEKILKQRKKHYAVNKEKILAYNKKRYNENKEDMLEYARQYGEENAEEISKRRRKAYWANRDIYIVKMREYRWENRDRLNKQCREWYKNNKEHVKAYSERYRQQPRVKAMRKANEQKRRTLKKQLLSTFTAKQWEECKDFFRDINGTLHCAYCSKPVKKATVEHFIPLSKGGPNIKSNILPVCFSCNSSKNNTDFFEWYPQQEFYSKKQEKKILEYLGVDGDIQQLSIL